MPEFNAPTMLIGLGGLGCQIVDMVYGWIPPDRRQGVGVHGFDTDVASLKKLKYIGGHLTQTSTRMMVGEYVHSEPIVKSWFPDNQILYRKTMENGAGQIRACSRLSFRSKMGKGGLESLEREMDSLFPVQGTDFQQSVRVLIVTSLAGGTGSGIFLQIAMNIRDIMETRFDRDKILIRGAFLLPDILINSGRLAPKEYDQVRANAYASMKELNAVTRAALGNWGGYPGVTVELEYKPDQVDLQGRTMHAITKKQLPYDFCFLYDYENAAGENLKGTLNSYLNQISRSVYIQLFSPIAENQISREDNQIRSTVRAGGLDMYCGSGVSTLIYPYDNIIEYCSLQWGISGLDENWLLLDQIYLEEKKAYEADIQMGRPRDELKRGQRYIDNLNTRVGGENPAPFLRQIERQVRLTDDKGNLGKYKSELYIDAIRRHVEDVLEKDDTLQRLATKCRPDETLVTVKNKAASEITRVETMLEELRREINRKVPEYRIMVYYELLGLDTQEENKKETREYSLNTWILSKNQPLHPVAVRYVLYQIESQLDQIVDDLRIKNELSREKIEEYKKKAFDLPDTSYQETPADRVKLALKQGFIGAAFKNEFKEFIDEYIQKSASQRNALIEYKNNYLLELVSTSLLRDIRALIEQWERFFNNLAETRYSLLNEANRRERQFDNPNDPTLDYVLATSDMMKKLWGKIQANLVSEVLPPEISEQIYLAIYSYYVNLTKGKILDPIKVEELYRDYILSYCRQSLKEKYAENLDMNVVRALREEARFAGVSNRTEEDYLRKRINPQLRKALPFVPSITDIRELVYWGIHPEAENELGDSTQNDIFQGNQISDEAFSRYEISAYQAYYGILAEQLPKFSSGTQSDMHKSEAGDYFSSYKRLINRLVTDGPDNEITPHLDKRWHLPAFLPDVNQNEITRDLDNIDRTLILGTIFECFKVVNEQGHLVYLFNKGDTSSLVMMNGEWVSGYPQELHNALGQNPAIIEYVLARSQEIKQKEISQKLPITEHQFIKGSSSIRIITNDDLNNILDLVLDLPMGTSANQMSSREADRVLTRLLAEIEKYYVDFYGKHREVMARAEAAKFIVKLWDESILQCQADKDSSSYNMWVNIIENYLTKLGYTERLTASSTK